MLRDSWTDPERRGEPDDPRPHPDAVAVVGRARFTWIGASVLRLEWAEDGVFEDRASLVAVHRNVAPPEWTLREDGDWTILEGGEGVTLRYRAGSEIFDDASLEVTVERDGRTIRWTPGARPTENLGGTVRTLDGEGGRVDLGPGLLSRDGWVWIDDSETPLFDGGDPGWVVPRRPGRRSDGYLLLHGGHVRSALRDWSAIGGRVPMPPRWAFGIWWSRYWPYTDAELLDLIEAYRARGIPLDVLVVDMDWHETFGLRWGRGERDAAGQRKGWTGYRWSGARFPEPRTFLAEAHARGVRVALNLHPASGVQRWEPSFDAVASALGLNPEEAEYVPFRIEDEAFARAFMEHVIRPLERQGVDFWWLDWQQWNETAVPGLTPTMWLNHVFFHDMEQREGRRPIILHRYGGLGSHRYQVGFSGDAASTWEALAFQPEFTATAANVLYGYWSHDIGGHEPGPVSAELFTRWMQLGALSPVLRTHTTRHPEAERRPWAFPPDEAEAMTRALRLRSSLVPYLYGAARTCWEEGISIVRPLYHDEPALEEAYHHPDVVWVGPDLVAAPVTAPADGDGLARRRLWLPPGAWIEWDSGARLEGGRVLERSYALDEIPLFVRAGAVIPRAPEGTRAAVTDAPLVVSVFPGADGTASLYEDEGDDLGYRSGACRRTTLSARWRSERVVEVEIAAAEGTFPGAVEERDVRLRLHHVPPPIRVHVSGEELPLREADDPRPGWSWDGERALLSVTLGRRAVDRALATSIELDGDPALIAEAPGTLARLRRACSELERLWPADAAPDELVRLAQAGRRATLALPDALDTLGELLEVGTGTVSLLDGLEGSPEVLRRARALLAPRSVGGGVSDVG